MSVCRSENCHWSELLRLRIVSSWATSAVGSESRSRWDVLISSPHDPKLPSPVFLIQVTRLPRNWSATSTPILVTDHSAARWMLRS